MSEVNPNQFVGNHAESYITVGIETFPDGSALATSRTIVIIEGEIKEDEEREYTHPVEIEAIRQASILTLDVLNGIDLGGLDEFK